MRLLKVAMLYAFITSCATQQEVYNVTHMISETDSAVNVWSSESFPLTNFIVATDTIYWFELSTLIIGDNTKRTTYLINKL
jgi:hypothetical protein